MATAAEIPILVASDAAERIRALDMQREFETMLEYTQRSIPGLRAIEVTPYFDPDEPAGPRLVITVYKELPDSEDDPARRQWDAWAIRTFSPDVFRWFALDVDYRTDHVR